MHTEGPVAPPELPTEEAEEQVAHEEIHLPPLSIWPITVAFGVTLGGMGLVTNVLVSFAGIAIMFGGIVGWIQELRHSHAQHH